MLSLNTAALQANPVDEDSDCWTRIEIEEAFISKETTRAHRDFFSAPEFGWHVLLGKSYVAGSTLYGKLYYPGCDQSKTTVRLRLVERDVFQDDHVATVEIQPGKYQYSMGKHGDRVRFTSKQYYPDAESGGDHLPDKARLVQNSYEGSVSFLGGDFTDYLKPARHPVVYLLKRDSNIKVDLRQGQARIFPDKANLERFLIIDAADVHHLRLRSSIGGSVQRYSIQAHYGKDRARLLRNAVLELSATDKRLGYFEFKSLSRSMVAYQQDDLHAACLPLIKQGRAAAGSRAFCALSLYQIGKPADVDYLDSIFENESERYRDIVGPAYRSSQRDKQKAREKTLRKKASRSITDK